MPNAVPERFREALSSVVDMIASGDVAALRASPLSRMSPRPLSLIATPVSASASASHSRGDAELASIDELVNQVSVPAAETASQPDHQAGQPAAQIVIGRRFHETMIACARCSGMRFLCIAARSLASRPERQ